MLHTPNHFYYLMYQYQQQHINHYINRPIVYLIPLLQHVLCQKLSLEFCFQLSIICEETSYGSSKTAVL